ncbi:MAG: hypothetical protein KKB50_10925 [Planctomycetes bacterium]|nr:hypothetical protein [Planctomycetota bacterium]
MDIGRSSLAKAALFALVVLVTCLGAANADVSPVFFSIQASNDSGTGTYEVLTSDVDYDAGTQTYSWSGSGIPIKDGSTQVAFLESALLSMKEDPQIALTFGVTAGTTDTHFVITPALLNFPTLNTPEGVASIGVTLTEVDGDDAALTGTGAGGYAFQTQYNGYVPGGTTFAQFIDLVEEPDAYGSETANGNTGGFVPIGVPVSNMSMQLDFSLTANDSASGTSVYVITPEPAQLALLVLGLFCAVRRR